MNPKKTNHSQGRLFEARLSEQLNPTHELFTFTRLLNWEALETTFADKFIAEVGAPAKPVRLVVGIMILQHMYGLSDESVVSGWVENPYWQYFCGYDFLQWKFPIHPTTLTKWRQRVGVEGIEKVLELLIQAALRSGTVAKNSIKKAIVDTTVMPKAITFPTDTKLYLKAIKELVNFAKSNKIELRQTYERIAPKTARMAGRYSHARKFKKAMQEVKRLKRYLGRVFRDLLRKLDDNEDLKKRATPVILTMAKVLLQEPDDKNKIYSVHEPHVECISKGKAHKKYEFGCKASIVVTHKEGLALSVQALHGNPYDGHTLKQALSHAEKMSGESIDKVFVDRGYKGHGIKDCEVIVASSRKKMSWRKWKEMSRRQSIEPHIGHMKSDGKLGLNYLKGKIGDQLNALLCAIGHNGRMILNFLRSIQPKPCSA
jgi:IS5 family transposase